jgi:predicted outer membrane repeat protein
MMFRLFLAIPIIGCFVAPAAAATFTVTNTANSGPGSLRQAILDANAAAGADTIVFSSLFDTPQTITLTSGDLAITDSVNANVTITGPGSMLLTISGNNASKIFTIAETPTVTISGVRLTGGNGVGTTPGNNFGGAIYSEGTLTLTNVVITGNTCTGDGGGVYSGGGDSLTVTGSTISNNSATGVNRTGGGVFIAPAGILTMSSTTVSGNSGTFGGGIYFFQTSTANVINGSTITGNTGTSGSITGAGGGIYLDTSTLTLNDSTVDANLAPTGGAGGIGGDAGTILTMNRSTVSRNQSRFNGAGISIQDYTAAVTNSTISGNVMNTTGTGAERTGGGLFISTLSSGRTVTISYSTIVNNSSVLAGGGVAARAVPAVANTIIANNTGDATAPDFSGTLNSQGYNLIKTATGATITGTTTGNIVGQDPSLTPLEANGGPTLTHRLLNGSVAIDAADPANFPATDQRGSGRPIDGDGSGPDRADIGAFERRPGTLQFSVAGYSALENTGSATITVNRVDGSDGDVTIQYSTSDGTAIAGSDYTPANGVLAFAHAATSRTFTVPIIDDTLLEDPDETVNLQVLGPALGAKLGSPSTAVLTILNDDAPLTISGRITTPAGQGLRNVVVQLIDSQGVIRRATTSSFGIYSFDNVRSGESYTMSVVSRRYRFAPRIGGFTASSNSIDFQGLE